MKKLIAICLLLTAQPALAEKQLIFFFAASCKYCHNLAPIIEKAGETFQIHILPTSLDGGTLPAFPEATKNLKLAQAFNVHSLPTVAGVDTVTKKGKVLMVGAHAYNDVMQRIAVWLEKGI